MKALRFTPVIRVCGVRDGRRPQPLVIDEAGHANAVWQLYCHADGSLSATEPGKRADGVPGGDDRSIAKASGSSNPHVARVLGSLRLRMDSGRASWFFVPANAQTGINGTTPPLPVVLLRPGMLVSLGDEFWIVSNLWSPEPIDAPAEVADKNCPVCGLELGCAPVVACLCGNYMHLESPDRPDDPEALNCYLTKMNCGSCQRPTSLEPQIVPEIPEPLLADEPDDDDFAKELPEAAALPRVPQIAGEPIQ